MKKYADERIQAMVAMYQQGYSVRAVAKKYQGSANAVSNHLKASGCEMRNHLESTKSKLIGNQAAFTDFEDEQAAYWYGFLLGDGSMSNKTNTATVGLAVKDEAHLVKLCNYLSFTGNLRRNENTRSVALQFSCKEISDRLKAQGLVAAKSTREKLPAFGYLHGEPARHFWRGLIDADGNIGLYGSIRVGIIGSEEVVTGFREFCIDVVGVVGKGETHTPVNSKNVLVSRFHGNDALKVLRYLYTDANVYLDRKFETAQTLLTHQAKFDKRVDDLGIRFRVVNGKDKWIAYALANDFQFNKTQRQKHVYLKTFKTKAEAVACRDEFLDLYNELKAA